MPALPFFSRGCALLAALALSLSPLAAGQAPGGFRNSDGSVIDKPLSEVLGWMWQAWRAGLPKPPFTPGQGYAGFPVLREAQARQPAQAGELSLTWIGHATSLLRLDGHTILLDPQFAERASPLSWAGPARKVALPLSLAELPHIDVVAISHNHYDHLDEASVLALNQQAGGPPVFVTPLGLDDWLRARGISRVQAVAWWDSVTVDGLTIHATPARHWSGRGLSDRNQSHWGGWAFRAGGLSAYFTGDTGYSEDFARIGATLGPFDLALIPVGAYLPREFMRDQHINPDEAARIHREVRARESIGVHWGTFELADDPLDAPFTEVPLARQRAGLNEQALRLLRHGETWRLGEAR